MNNKKEFGALEELENMFTLTESVKLYIPTETMDGLIVDNSKVLKACAVAMDEFFGGATVTDGVGYWSDNDGKLYTENVNIINSNTDKLDDKKAYKLIELARYVKKELEQDAVTIEVNNKMKFI